MVVLRLRQSQGVKRLRESTLPLRAKERETELSKEIATDGDTTDEYRTATESGE